MAAGWVAVKWGWGPAALHLPDKEQKVVLWEPDVEEEGNARAELLRGCAWAYDYLGYAASGRIRESEFPIMKAGIIKGRY